MSRTQVWQPVATNPPSKFMIFRTSGGVSRTETGFCIQIILLMTSNPMKAVAVKTKVGETAHIRFNEEKTNLIISYYDRAKGKTVQFIFEGSLASRNWSFVRDDELNPLDQNSLSIIVQIAEDLAEEWVEKEKNPSETLTMQTVLKVVGSTEK